jgi:GMP synthase (glutamine-hydrolysing)
MRLSAEETPRLKTKFWVDALLRRGGLLGLALFVVKKGDEEAGALLLKQNFLGSGFTVLAQTLSEHGEKAWFRATGSDPISEEQANAYINRQVSRDSDLWVIEIEDKEGRLPFDDPLLES